MFEKTEHVFCHGNMTKNFLKVHRIGIALFSTDNTRWVMRNGKIPIY